MKRKELFKQLIIEFHQYGIPDFIERELKLPVNTGKIISVIGVRRSGKTYLIFQTIKKLLENVPIERIIYINFEDERINITSEELSLILEAYKELYPNIPLKDLYLFFDEIQNITGWEKFIRRVYDRYTKNIYITGSNSKLLSKEIATALRGRTLSYEVFPLSFKEYLAFKDLSFEEKDFYNIEKRGLWKKEFLGYLEYGGFPEVVYLNDKNLKLKTLQNYFEVMIYKDLVERFEIKNPLILKYFIKRIIENLGKPLSVNNIFNELKSQGYKISKDALYQYLEYIEDIYLSIIIKKYSKSILKSELSQKKAYIVDNGLVNALSFSFKGVYGTLLENLVVKEFRLRGYEIFYFKENKECDLIILNKYQTMPIQVSYSLSDKKTMERELNGLLEAVKFLNVKKGVILTFDDFDTTTIDGVEVQILPAYYYFTVLA
ncbi:ATP-binding protein [Sulfurihydrogenibium subterraneum]|uniref:ATP-binding protein n=1 Tax=Sulfurihydrogenibium subterraneum TaxID=171121 RepID=UPI00048CB745|nr:ATP-binding protein [Sulfurihydrogenibium subterraneum]